jgi:hypothetical protein
MPGIEYKVTEHDYYFYPGFGRKSLGLKVLPGELFEVSITGGGFDFFIPSGPKGWKLPKLIINLLDSFYGAVANTKLEHRDLNPAEIYLQMNGEVFSAADLEGGIRGVTEEINFEEVFINEYRRPEVNELNAAFNKIVILNTLVAFKIKIRVHKPS